MEENIREISAASRKKLIKRHTVKVVTSMNIIPTDLKKMRLHDALSFYGLSIPFTQDQLREKRRKLMKTAHPDEGGNTEAQQILTDILIFLKNMQK